MRVHSIKDRLDTIIHKLADKDYKTKEDQDLEKSLIEKKNCIIDELNKVLVTGEENGTQSHHTASGMEMKAPLIFMDSPDMDSMENITELDDFLPIIGEDSFLPKEQTEDFIPLPIINELGYNEQLVENLNAEQYSSLQEMRSVWLLPGTPPLTRTRS